VRSVAEVELAVAVAVVSTVPGGNLAIGALAGLLLHWGSKAFARGLRWRPTEVPTGQAAMQRLVAVMERVVPSG